MILVPNYYKKFKCIADKCRHSCCVGWEIDIDAATMDYYKQLGGEMGKKFSENIEYSEDAPHFVLDENERCPFLLASGLCEIISAFGEDSLCNICTDHPRFRSFYESFTEIGLGLCCEEAARLILSETEPFSLIADEEILLTTEEEFVLNFRDKLFKIMQQRNISIKKRFSAIQKELGFSGFSLKDLCDIYLSLERLDESWTGILTDLKDFSFAEEIFSAEELQIPFEQIACYFLFRHLSEAIWDGELEKRVKLALAGCFLIGALCERYKEKHGSVQIEQMADFARMYSAEVEYSEENISTLLSAL